MLSLKKRNARDHDNRPITVTLFRVSDAYPYMVQVTWTSTRTATRPPERDATFYQSRDMAVAAYRYNPYECQMRTRGRSCRHFTEAAQEARDKGFAEDFRQALILDGKRREGRV